jgi:hypothetical protein
MPNTQPHYNPLPGTGALGRCFNIFDTYTVPNGPILFDLKTGKNTFQWGGITYALADNVSNPQMLATGNAVCDVYQSRDEFSQQLSQQAGLQGHYKAFSAEFDEEYSVNRQTETEYSYALLKVDYDSYLVTLQDSSAAYLLSAIKNDSAYQNMPSDFTDDNQGQFFEFFIRYGTHYISAVKCGAQLQMSSKILKSYNYSEQEIKANMQAEFNALLGGVSANANVGWSQVNKNWFTSQSTRVQVIGGNTSILQLVIPQYGDNHVDTYGEWLGSIDQTPAPRDLTLRPISDIFPSNRHHAVEEAIEAYTHANVGLHVNGADSAQATNCYIILNGKSYVPDMNAIKAVDAYGHPCGGLLLAIFDRKTLRNQLYKTYDVEYNRFNASAATDWQPAAQAAYQQAVNDTQSYAGRSDVLVCLLFWGANTLYGFPSSNFEGFMRNLGAGSGLDTWSGKHNSTGAATMAYALVGVPDGSGNSVELLTTSTSSREYLSNRPHPGLTCDVFLEPHLHRGDMLFTPR